MTAAVPPPMTSSFHNEEISSVKVVIWTADQERWVKIHLEPGWCEDRRAPRIAEAGVLTATCEDRRVRDEIVHVQVGFTLLRSKTQRT